MTWLGVDGGGTRSCALAVDAQGRKLAAVEGPPGLVDPQEPSATAAVVAELARRAAQSAGTPLPLEGLWAGLAGAGQEGPRRAVEAALEAAGVARRIGVGTDVEAARADAFGEGPGILLVAGTGSVALAVNPRGERVTVGGWGSALDDEGSGYRIGLDGLRAVVRSADGRAPETSLGRALLQQTGAASPMELVAWTAAAAKRDVAALAPTVVGAADAGDAAAARVVRKALDALQELLEAVLARTGKWGAPPPLALSGGLVRADSPFHEPLAAIGTNLGCDVRPAPVVPERGAASKALRLGRAGRLDRARQLGQPGRLDRSGLQ